MNEEQSAIELTKYLIVLKMKINSTKYQAWHELGHAVIAILKGVEVELVELIDDASRDVAGRAKISVTSGITRKFIACGGTAAEMFLFSELYLDMSGNQNIVEEIVANAKFDLFTFFDIPYDADYEFSEAQKSEYMMFVTNDVQPLLDGLNEKLEEMADKLCSMEIISGEEIAQILQREEEEW